MVITGVSKYRNHKVIRRKDSVSEHLDLLFVTEQPTGELELDTAVYLVSRDDTHTFLCCISGQDITEFRDSLIATINNYRI